MVGSAVAHRVAGKGLDILRGECIRPQPPSRPPVCPYLGRCGTIGRDRAAQRGCRLPWRRRFSELRQRLDPAFPTALVGQRTDWNDLLPTSRFRLTAAGQVLRPDDSFRRNLPFVVPRGDRPLYLQQRPLNSDGPEEGPNDSFPPRRSALRDPKETAARFLVNGRFTPRSSPSPKPSIQP